MGSWGWRCGPVQEFMLIFCHLREYTNRRSNANAPRFGTFTRGRIKEHTGTK